MNDFNTRDFSAYLRRLALLFGAVALLVLTFNVVVDPYGVFGLVKIEGFNAKKAMFKGSRHRLGKALVLQSTKPDVIFFGSSSTHVGLDSRHPRWKRGESGSYNAGLNGANMYEVYRYLQHALEVTPVDTVVIGLELSMFRAGDAPAVAGMESWLARSADGRYQPPWLYAIPPAFLSYDSIYASIQTVRKQSEINYGFLPSGQPELAPLIRRIEASKGHRNAFRNVERWEQESVPPMDPDLSQERNLGYLERVLALCHEHAVALHLFFSPRHVWALESLTLTGQWPMFENWKRGVSAANEQIAARAGAAPYPLWDFATYNPYTAEPIPPIDDAQSAMKWHWEWGHYKKELGDIVLDTLAGPCREEIRPEQLGICLSGANIEAHLESQREARERYHRRSPQVRSEIGEIIAEIRASKSAPAQAQIPPDSPQTGG